MEYQRPAKGIMSDADLGDTKFYTVSCTCGNPDDQIRLEVEADDVISVHVWTTVKTPWWQRSWDSDSKFAGYVNGLTHRLKMTWNLWVRGYLENESWTILSEQQAYNLAETLKEAINDVREQKERKYGNAKKQSS